MLSTPATVSRETDTSPLAQVFAFREDPPYTTPNAPRVHASARSRLIFRASPTHTLVFKRLYSVNKRINLSDGTYGCTQACVNHQPFGSLEDQTASDDDGVSGR